MSVLTALVQKYNFVCTGVYVERCQCLNEIHQLLIERKLNCLDFSCIFQADENRHKKTKQNKKHEDEINRTSSYHTTHGWILNSFASFTLF